MTELLVLWVLLWIVILFVWGLWSASAALARWRPRRRPEERPQKPSRAEMLKEEREQAASRERRAKREDARIEVVHFYEDHAHLLREALPPALFRSQLNARFLEIMTPEAAWHAAQEMIAGMLPFVAEARERQRAREEEARERAERTRQLQKQIHELEDQLRRLQASTVGDPDMIAAEVEETQRQLQALRDEREALGPLEGSAS